jgi:hypothetical protein
MRMNAAPEVEFKVEPLDCCGSTIYRICERQGSSDRWLKTLGQPDFDRHADAEDAVDRLRKERSR